MSRASGVGGDATGKGGYGAAIESVGAGDCGASAYRRELFEQFARGELKEWDFKEFLQAKEEQIAQLAEKMKRICK